MFAIWRKNWLYAANNPYELLFKSLNSDSRQQCRSQQKSNRMDEITVRAHLLLEPLEMTLFKVLTLRKKLSDGSWHIEIDDGIFDWFRLLLIRSLSRSCFQRLLEGREISQRNNLIQLVFGSSCGLGKYFEIFFCYFYLFNFKL